MMNKNKKITALMLGFAGVIAVLIMSIFINPDTVKTFIVNISCPDIGKIVSIILTIGWIVVAVLIVIAFQNFKIAVWFTIAYSAYFACLVIIWANDSPNFNPHAANLVGFLWLVIFVFITGFIDSLD